MSRLLKDIGTLEWCRRTNGVLSAPERLRYTAAGVLETVRSLPRLLLFRLGWTGGGPDPSAFAPPDTTLARRVVEASMHLDPMFVQHGYRSYLFARALGARDGLACDGEALFAAAMLHDYAFPNIDTTDDRCFTLAGAEIAAEVLSECGLSPALQHDVLDAITLHFNPRVPREQGVLQHLLHDGVFIDVLGARAWHLDPLGYQRVVERHPRHGFIHRATPGLRAHARRVPCSRADQALRCGFNMAQRLGPGYAHEARTRQPPALTHPPGQGDARQQTQS